MRGPGRRFKKGQSGNPAGPKPSAMTKVAVKRMAYDDYADMVSVIFYSTKAEVEAIAEDESAHLIKRTAAKVLLKAFANSCPLTLETLNQRVIGRVRDVTPVSDGQSRTGQALLEEFRKVVNDPKNERTS